MSANDDLMRAALRRTLERLTALEDRVALVEDVQAAFSAIIADLSSVRGELERAAVGGRDDGA